MVFGEGACSTHLARAADGDWVKHWWNLLSPHVCRSGGCAVMGPGSGVDKANKSQLRGQSQPRHLPGGHARGGSGGRRRTSPASTQHLQRQRFSAVVDRRVQAARDTQSVMDADEAQNEADSLLWEEVVQAEEAAQIQKRRQMREEEEAAKVAARIEDWAVWKCGAAAAARLREGQDWAAWTNAQVRAADMELRQREAALYRDWEQWEVMNTPPSGSRARTRATYKVEAAVLVDGKQAAKKARWLVDMRRDGKVGMHFTVEPHDGALASPPGMPGLPGSRNQTTGRSGHVMKWMAGTCLRRHPVRHAP